MLKNCKPEETAEGLRFDQGKLRMDLIPPEAEEAMARVLTFAAGKYAERNWEKGMAWSRCYASLRRHLSDWWQGKDIDEESGLPTIEHILWNAMALVTYYTRQIGTDDRPHRVLETIAFRQGREG